MSSPLSGLARCVARVPLFTPLTVFVEDQVSWHRAAGSPAARASLRAELTRQGTPEALLAFARRFFPPTQIPEEICGLLRLAAREGVKRVGEIGTAQGGTCFLLMHAIPGVDLSLGLDLHVRHKSLLRGLAPEGCEFHAIERSSYAPETVARVGRVLADRTLDLLLIDGDHRYEGALSDFRAYRRHVREGGLIAFHDIRPTGIEEPGKPEECWAGGVPRLWRELKELHDDSWEFIADPNQHGFGLGVLRNHLGSG